VVATFGVSAAPLVGNRVPIRACFLLERGARFEVFRQLTAIFRDRLRRYGLRHRLRREQQQHDR